LKEELQKKKNLAWKFKNMYKLKSNPFKKKAEKEKYRF